ncbi:MAG: putative peptidoglycan glycosyltransferase FtsW [Candidatus Saccharibacteria bacterium]|nr:putative peptidoglycan glycosyltransferase FtsW [Candidatus Saccharibacteria bacterium]
MPQAQPRRSDFSLRGHWRQFLEIVRMASDDRKNVTSFNRRESRTKRFDTSNSVIVRHHRPDYKIVMFMVLLMLFGLVLIYAIGPRVNINNQTAFFVKQLISLIVAVLSFVVASKVSLSSVRRLSFPILLFALGVGLILFISSIGPMRALNVAQCTYGACRWIRIGNSFTIQVAEIIKLAMIIFLATIWRYFSEHNRFNSLQNTVYSIIVIAIAILMIVVWQNDLGTGISLIFIVLAMLWMAGVKRILMFGLFIVLALAGGIAVALKPHRIARVMTFLEGDNVAITDQNRHIVQAKIAIGSGGIFGLGIGNSIQATGYLPEAVNDSIFAIIGEVFGFVGCVVIIGLFVGLITCLLRGAALSHDVFNRLLMTGSGVWILAHFLINTTSMLGIAPMTGITLPFLSFGGTSMIFLAAAVGLAFNASRFTAHSVYLEKKEVKR